MPLPCSAAPSFLWHLWLLFRGSTFFRVLASYLQTGYNRSLLNWRSWKHVLGEILSEFTSGCRLARLAVKGFYSVSFNRVPGIELWNRQLVYISASLTFKIVIFLRSSNIVVKYQKTLALIWYTHNVVKLPCFPLEALVFRTLERGYSFMTMHDREGTSDRSAVVRIITVTGRVIWSSEQYSVINERLQRETSHDHGRDGDSGVTWAEFSAGSGISPAPSSTLTLRHWDTETRAVWECRGPYCGGGVLLTYLGTDRELELVGGRPRLLTPITVIHLVLLYETSSRLLKSFSFYPQTLAELIGAIIRGLVPNA